MTVRLRPCAMKVIRLIVVTCLGGLLPTASVGQTIVWTDINARRIQRKDVNGGEVGTIVQFPSSPAATQIHYDPIAAKLYYLFYAPPSTFQRANLDGSEPENIPTPSWGNFTLNVESRKLYWISRDDSGTRSVLNRSELNGSGVESHIYPCCLLTLEALGDDLDVVAQHGPFRFAHGYELHAVASFRSSSGPWDKGRDARPAIRCSGSAVRSQRTRE